MTPFGKVQEDRDIIWGLLPDITGLIGINASASTKKPFNPMAEGCRSKSILGSAISSLDFLSEALFTAQRTDHIPLCLVFAVQILIEVFHITRHDNERAYSEVSYTATNICRVLDQYSACSQNLISAKWDSDPKNGHILKDIHDFARKWVLDDDLIGSYARRASPNSQRDDRKFWLLRHHPQLCGTMITYVNCEMQKAGQKLASSWGCVLACIHLYNAATQAGFLKSLWFDAERIYNLHETSRLFSGNVPTNPAESLKKFSIVPSRRLFSTPPDEVPKPFTEAESVAKFLSYRYSDTHPHSSSRKPSPTQISHEGVYHILAEARAACETTQLNPSGKTRYLGRNHVAIARETGNLTPLEFLDTLCMAVEYESDLPVFDYISLHMRCLTLLKQLYRECEAELKFRYGSGDVNRESLPLNFGKEKNCIICRIGSLSMMLRLGLKG